MIKFPLIAGYDSDFAIDVFDDAEVSRDEDAFAASALRLPIGSESAWMMHLHFYGYTSHSRSHETTECSCQIVKRYA
jgi:hypothetical protein